MRRVLLAGALALGGCSGEVHRHFFVEVDDGALLKVYLDGNLDSDVIILLLHGGPRGSSHAYDYGDWARDVESDYAVAYLDQRGQGASQGRLDTQTYGLQRAADDVEQVVGVLRARFGPQVDLYLLGHSWGGMLGTLALVDTGVQPEISGWIETAGCHDALRERAYSRDMLVEVGAAEIAAGRNVEQWDEIVAFAEGIEPDGALSQEESLMLVRYGYRAEFLIDGIAWDGGIPEGIAWAFRDPQRSLVQWWAGSRALDNLAFEGDNAALTERLPEIAVPSRFVYGRWDFVCAPRLGEDGAQLVSNDERELTILEASGHSLMSNEPEAFTAAIEGFVERTRDR